MSAKWVSVFLSVTGLVTGLLGLFLPWAEWGWMPGRYGAWNPTLGINIPLGVFSFIGWLIATLSWILFEARKQELLLVLPMIGGIIIMICSFAWIVIHPSVLLFMSSSHPYRASYGAYVSLVGGALIFSGAALAFYFYSIYRS